MGLLFCMNIAPILMLEASHSTSKAFLKSGKAKIGATQSLSLNKLKALSCSTSYLNLTFSQF